MNERNWHDGLSPAPPMTNRIALSLLMLIAVTFAADQLWLAGTLPLAAARMMDRLIEYLSFWR